MNRVFRQEIKYVIPRLTFMKMQKELDILLQRDQHAQESGYTVRSQYYDSLTDQDLRDNLSGVMEKRKIRVRIYSPNDPYAKLEYKCKSGMDSTKYSLKISREEALMMEKHQYDFLLNHSEELATFLYVKMNHDVYRPKTIIEYERIAYTYPQGNVRVTFDTNLKGSAVPYGLYDQLPCYFPLMADSMGTLEVKFDTYLPAIVQRIVRQINSLPEASSKYSRARLIYE